MAGKKSTPPSQTLTRRLRFLIGNLDNASVDSSAKQVCGWINSFAHQDDRLRGLVQVTAELVLEKATERPSEDSHRFLGRLCKILDAATGGEYSKTLNVLWKEELQAVSAELLANDTAEAGSWPECVALVSFAGELCRNELLRIDALRSCVITLSGSRSNLGLGVACTLLEATGDAICRDREGKNCFNAAIKAMLSASRGSGVPAYMRSRVQALAARRTPEGILGGFSAAIGAMLGSASGGSVVPVYKRSSVQALAVRPTPEEVLSNSSDDDHWDEATAHSDDGEGSPPYQPVSQLCKPKHPKLYFESGDIVFVCGGSSFRVQSDLLSRNSQTFSDMLQRMRADGDHLSDGRPCIHLPDSAKDFATLLEVFYTSGFLHRHKTPKFATFSSLLQMTTKYQFEGIRSQILLDLSPAYPTKLSEYEESTCRGEAVFGVPTPHPNSVLELFVKCNVAFALPFAYYRACITDDHPSLVSSTEGARLSPDTLKAALRGQARLREGGMELASELAFQNCTAWRCPGNSSSGRAPVFDWIHPNAAPTGAIFEKGTFPAVDGYCSKCTQVFAQGLSTAKEKTWKNLPSYFDLLPWDNEIYRPAQS